MVQKIWNQILEKKDVRQSLSKLRELVKEQKNKEICQKIVCENSLVLESLLGAEDAKTRKNAALLIGDLEISSMQPVLSIFGHKKILAIFYFRFTLSSTFRCLTSVFGMGTGEPPSYFHQYIFSIN